MKSRIAFHLGSNDHGFANARAAAEHFGPNIHFKQFKPEMPQDASMNQADLSEILFFGEGTTSTFADYNAREFVKQFKRQFELAEGIAAASKLEVKHLYFIDTATLVRNEKRLSFAQAVVNKLHAAGFKNVVVHRIEKPAKCKRDDFSTSLTLDGKVQANITFFKAKASVRSPSLYFANEANPKDVLDNPRHIFLRGENKFTKQSRVTREIVKHQCAQQIIATNELRRLSVNFKSELNPSKAKKIRRQLKTIVHQMELATKYEWRSTLREADAYLSNHTDLGSSFLQPGSQVRGAVKRIIDTHAGHDAQANVDRSNKRANFFPDFKERAATLMEILRLELDELRGRKAWFFYGYEIETKVRKLAALRTLHGQDDLYGMIDAAMRLRSDKRVMRSFKRHHTSDLINEIATFMPAALIDPSLLDSQPANRV